ncbi:MAG: DUF6125 family protein [Candidatus Zixiibacteriota bacterium]
MSEDSRGMLEDAAKLWLAHDGLWFQEIEKAFGIEKAIELDKNAWAKFTVIEAKRIMSRHQLPEKGGLAAHKIALGFRLYAYVNEQEIVNETPSSFEFRMKECRVQSARQRQGMTPFPCKEVGIVEYSLFAKTIDPAIKTECISCPPDAKQTGFWCAWRFSV